MLVAGSGAAAPRRPRRRLPGVAKVLLADAAHLAAPVAENVAAVALPLIRAGGYTHVLASATGFGKSVAPRIAALLDVAQISEIIAVESPDTFVRPIYAGSAFATVQSKDAIKVITVRATAFDARRRRRRQRRGRERRRGAPTPGSRGSPGRRSTSRTGPSSPARASSSPAGGRWAAPRTSSCIDALAAKLNAAVGASRAAVDAGYVPNDYQVGQTGKIVAPDLYIAVGISGAIQHLAGMKDSKVIVAINKDPEAPIFQIADYGLVGDLFEVGSGADRRARLTARAAACARRPRRAARSRRDRRRADRRRSLRGVD